MAIFTKFTLLSKNKKRSFQRGFSNLLSVTFCLVEPSGLKFRVVGDVNVEDLYPDPYLFDTVIEPALDRADTVEHGRQLSPIVKLTGLQVHEALRVRDHTRNYISSLFVQEHIREASLASRASLASGAEEVPRSEFFWALTVELIRRPKLRSYQQIAILLIHREALFGPGLLEMNQAHPSFGSDAEYQRQFKEKRLSTLLEMRRLFEKQPFHPGLSMMGNLTIMVPSIGTSLLSTIDELDRRTEEGEGIAITGLRSRRKKRSEI